jgi:hypothetical protein
MERYYGPTSRIWTDTMGLLLEIKESYNEPTSGVGKNTMGLLLEYK